MQPCLRTPAYVVQASLQPWYRSSLEQMRMTSWGTQSAITHLGSDKMLSLCYALSVQVSKQPLLAVREHL